MKKLRTKRLLSLILALAMMLTASPIGVHAANATIAGPIETVVVGEDAAALRENNFNMGWKFYLGDNSSASNQNFDDSAWDNVNLPHDFSILQHFTSSGEAESGFLPGGTGWYRKSFVIGEESAGKTFLLNFDGVYKNAYVYVNGTFVGEHHYGYTSFAFDITRHLVCDGATQNVVAVKAVNDLPSSRWYSGSGIYRDVTLYALDPVHVDLNGVTVTTPNVANDDGYTVAEVELVNNSSRDVHATVRTMIRSKGYTANEVNVENTVTIGANSSAVVTNSGINFAYRLWDLDDPKLYTAVTEVVVDGKVVDTCETEFGYRWFEFKSTGFHLNGEPVKLNGVCMHHDQGGLGAAAYYDAMYRQLSIMKDMGCNAIRTAHNPADEQYIQICNELGLLVIEETFDGLDLAKNGNYNDFSLHFHSPASSGLYGYASGMTCAEYAARSTVKRDRNAPAIIAWSVGNEIQQDSGTHSSYLTIAQNYISWVNSVDGTRPVTIGDNTRGGNSTLNNVINAIINAGGIAGYNYANSASTLYSLCQSYGGSKGVIIASETSSATNSRGQYKNQYNNSNSDGYYHLTSYDTSSVSWGIPAHDSIYNTYQYDCVAGEFVWTGFDYLGEPTPWNGTGTGDSGRGAIPNSSYFGIVETTGFPKDSYYLYRSQWNKNDTTVHLVTAWDANNQYVTGGKTPVWLYSNAHKVDLYLNDQLIGTANRTVNTSPAGHTYYTYSSTSSNTNVCSVANGSGADALYAVFNVAYTAGTLTAKAYNEAGTLVDTYSVSTPGAASRLAASANRTEIPADNQSLVYVEIDVTDANGNLKTTASNNITFTVDGPAEIAAVDNGDQATVRKYQNSYVLTDRANANINAYAGKALVILRATDEAGDITLNIASDGLAGQTITINAVDSEGNSSSGLVSYAMVRDYSVKSGTAPALGNAITGCLADGTTVEGTITWEPVSEELYTTAGDYTITGVASFPGYENVNVSARLHIIANVIALRNISAATMENTAVTLPSTVRGVLADGTLAGEFNVEWDEVDASAFDVVGEIVTIHGTAVILGDETLDVTCTVRVAEAVNTDSRNAALTADTVTQDIPAGSQSDNLASINNGVLKPGDNTHERWTNWGNRKNSDNATLTLFWNTAVLLSHVNLYYYYDNCCAYPQSIVFSYSLNGQDYQEIGHTEELVETYNLGAMYTYTFDEPINPVYLKVKLTQQGGTSGSNCVGLTELEAMTYAADFEMNSSAALSSIAVDGNPVEGFSADILTYEADGSIVTANTAVNAGITVLPEHEGIVRILTVSEDGSAEQTYAVTVGKTCNHPNTELRGNRAATCTEDGYTGDTWCTDCDTLIASGSTIAAAGHKWNAGVITQEPTESADGIRTFTCTVCSATRTESVKYEPGLKAPTVSLSLAKTSDGKITVIGRVDDYANLDDYYEITAHGLLYIQSSRIGTSTLHVNTNGRTKVNCTAYKADGSFQYSFRPTTKSTAYNFRAYVTYKNTDTGKTVTVYSNILRCSYNSIG